MKTAMPYVHLFKMIGFLSCWTLLCWIFFSGDNNIFNEVNIKTCFILKKVKVQYFSGSILSKQHLVLEQKVVLNIDKTPRLNESSLVPLIQPLMPNVPLEIWEENKEKQWFSKTSCGRWSCEH